MRFFKKLALCGVLITSLMSMKPALADNLTDNFANLATGGKGGWLNVTRPLTEADMKGRLVLLDFWTYGCVNCIHIVPDLKALEAKFGDKLLIIGVHSAKFKGEQGNPRILSAAKRFGLEHPVINDSDFAIWKSFKVEAWPTLVLLDTAGNEISRYEGEGHLSALDMDITNGIKSAAISSGAPTITSLIPKDTKTSALSFPARIKQAGNLFYIADAGNNRIIAVDGNGLIVKKFDGFHNPRGFAVSKDETTLYVADTDAHSLIQVDVATGAKQTLGGDGKRGRIWASPWDIDFTSSGEDLVIAMAGTHQLRDYNIPDKESDMFAGNGRESVKDDDAEDAELAQPSGVFTAMDGSVYFVDAESSALRVVKDGKVKTLIGTGLFDFGLVDGPYPMGKMQHPQGLFVKEDKVYIADTYNDALRIYDLGINQLSTVKTTGETLNEPGSVWVGDGYALIADTNNHRILKLDIQSGVLSVWPINENKI